MKVKLDNVLIASPAAATVAAVAVLQSLMGVLGKGEEIFWFSTLSNAHIRH